MKKILTTVAMVLLLNSAHSWAEDTSVLVNQGFSLPAVVEQPTGTAIGVVVLIHGSGSHSKDEDLGPAAKDKTPHPFFKNLSAALVNQGFAVLRYDKRNYALAESKKLGQWSDFHQKSVEDLVAKPYSAFVHDAVSAVAAARLTFPNQPVYLLGHSEGTWVALQVAKLDGNIAGVAHIGYSGPSIDTLTFEQTVYRPLSVFRRLDKNADGSLDSKELQAGGMEGASLAMQLSILDLDKDSQISESEFKAGNLSNMLVHPYFSTNILADAASYPTSNSLVAEANYKIAFFQGEWDNQTPSYNVKALEIAENAAWKRGNKLFRYYPKVGHALDPRQDYYDVWFTVCPKETLDDVASQMKVFFSR